jgi:hypothetical protein
MNRNQYQKNQDGVNVIVELEGSQNRHIYHGNIEFKNPRVISDLEIIGIAFANMSNEDKLRLAKDIVKKMDGFAISNVSNGIIKCGDIVELNSKL